MLVAQADASELARPASRWAPLCLALLLCFCAAAPNLWGALSLGYYFDDYALFQRYETDKSTTAYLATAPEYTGPTRWLLDRSLILFMHKGPPLPVIAHGILLAGHTAAALFVGVLLRASGIGRGASCAATVFFFISPLTSNARLQYGNIGYVLHALELISAFFFFVAALRSRRTLSVVVFSSLALLVFMLASTTLEQGLFLGIAWALLLFSTRSVSRATAAPQRRFLVFVVLVATTLGFAAGLRAVSVHQKTSSYARIEGNPLKNAVLLLTDWLPRSVWVSHFKLPAVFFGNVLGGRDWFGTETTRLQEGLLLTACALTGGAILAAALSHGYARGTPQDFGGRETAPIRRCAPWLLAWSFLFVASYAPIAAAGRTQGRSSLMRGSYVPAIWLSCLVGETWDWAERRGRRRALAMLAGGYVTASTVGTLCYVEYLRLDRELQAQTVAAITAELTRWRNPTVPRAIFLIDAPDDLLRDLPCLTGLTSSLREHIGDIPGGRAVVLIARDGPPKSPLPIELTRKALFLRMQPTHEAGSLLGWRIAPEHNEREMAAERLSQRHWRFSL